MADAVFVRSSSGDVVCGRRGEVRQIFMRVILLLVFGVMVLSSCGKKEEQSAQEKKPEMVLSAVSYADLPGWGSDDFQSFVQAFARSCGKISGRAPEEDFGAKPAFGKVGAWQAACADFENADKSGLDLKAFFEARFTPYAVFADDDPVGLFTGYYEASLRGSREKSDVYHVPLYKRPDDLVMVDLGLFREALKGQRIAGRVVGGNLKPYESRSDIVAGNWTHGDKVLVWVDDSVDAFFVQIQGSGIVTMDDGSTMRIGYAGQNGYPYYAIGRELIARGELTKENVSMQSIRAWLEAHPEQAGEVMNTNGSYVFFQRIDGDGPMGAQGVALTPGRSLAVDRTQMPYGAPLWVDIAPPVEGANAIKRLMIAQDTGGAIVGPVRGDVFWGYGKIAEEMAGKMKSQGRYWVLVPHDRSVDNVDKSIK